MIVSFILAVLFELLFPIALAIWFCRRFRVSGKLVWIGALIFFASQVVHIPVLYGIQSLFQQGILPMPPLLWGLLFSAVLAGLLAGLSEETARLVGFHGLGSRTRSGAARPWAARSWAAGVALGIGHGGLESFLVGFSGLANVVVMTTQATNPGLIPLPPDILSAVEQAAADFWGMPWHLPLAGAFERLCAMTIQISLAVLVMQTFLRRSAWYYVAAVLLHTLVDAVAVYLVGIGWRVWAIEGAIALLALFSLGIILYYRRKGDPSQPALERAPTPPAPEILPTAEMPQVLQKRE